MTTPTAAELGRYNVRPLTPGPESARPIPERESRRRYIFRHEQATHVVEWAHFVVRPFAGLRAAAVVDPHTGAIPVDLDADRLAPSAALGQLRPMVDNMTSERSVRRLDPRKLERAR